MRRERQTKGQRVTSAALCSRDRDELGLKIAFQTGMTECSFLAGTETENKT